MMYLMSIVLAVMASSVSDELVYTPVTPCRIADTRVPTAVSQVVAANGISAFLVRGDAFRTGFKNRGIGVPIEFSFVDQGGNPDGCGVLLEARAVELTITVLPQQAKGGFLIAWKHEIDHFLPFGNIPVPRKPPNTATVTWNADDAVSTVSALVEVCHPDEAPFGDCNEDILVKALGAPVHLIVDVSGYYTRIY